MGFDLIKIKSTSYLLFPVLQHSLALLFNLKRMNRLSCFAIIAWLAVEIL